MGRKTTCAYDAGGRLIQKRRADGKVVVYRYDDYGNLTEVDDGEFPVRRRYDVLGNIVRIEYPAIRRTLQYRYDLREPRGVRRFGRPEGRVHLRSDGSVGVHRVVGR